MKLTGAQLRLLERAGRNEFGSVIVHTAAERRVADRLEHRGLLRQPVLCHVWSDYFITDTGRAAILESSP